MTKLPQEIAKLKRELEDAGYPEGHPRHEPLFLQRRVERCRELRGLYSCQDCSAFYECPFVKELGIHLKYSNAQGELR